MKKFKIKKNSHYSGLHINPFINKSELLCKVIFNETCKYNLETIDQLDFNKLIGLSFGLHHNNSIRIGWRYDNINNKIEICPYIYYLGNKPKGWEVPVISYINLNEQYYFKIKRTHDKYIIEVLANTTDLISYYEFPITSSSIPKFGYVLYPYFGGNRKAPHDIEIEIDYHTYK